MRMDDGDDDEMEKAIWICIWFGCFNGKRQLTSSKLLLPLGKREGVVVAACVQSVS